ncbi:hypothetical protein KVR01_013295 [Diaporthe batatas]|uniref:uncharacterized protein n=1 Tax=Diaporthe batatas TaxID=748121 RepID=UPI001D04C76B|nr:uncharacterized protein KVR01_013295 [Diaporthe batatas]KAG8156882.1 hypothetical protein KVR01_013295 [Diaporthe batatas]
MSSQKDNASQPNQASQPKISTPPEQATQPERPPGPPSDDTVLVWHQVKVYHALPRPTMDGVYAEFREIFDGWTKERFQNVHPDARRALKYALRTGGVYTGPVRKHTAEALADIAQLPCVENGMWPPAPPWDRQEFLQASFTPGGEAGLLQWKELDILRRLDLPPQLPPPSTPAPQGQIPAQHVPQPVPFQALLKDPQPGPATVWGPTQQPPWPPIQGAPVPGQIRQAQNLALLQGQAGQGQLQPGPQLQTDSPQFNSGSTQPPQPNPRQAPRNGNRGYRSEPYPSSFNSYSNPTFRAALRGAAAVSRSHTPLISTPLVSGQTVDEDDGNIGDSDKKQD